MTAALLATSTSESVRQVLIWGGVLILAVVVLFGGLWYYRRWWLERNVGDGGPSWTLDDLRRMRSEGQITDEEYQVLRATLLGSFRQADGGGPAQGGPTSPVEGKKTGE
ncbi:MAG TPA: SHOCT domain-containing protein [Phycisphaerae bacterium]|nr:SHOCT domain-containing protein [Phycisphaerae bacterium]